MKDIYPTDEEIEKIRKWDYHDFNGLMEFVRDRWSYPQYWYELKKNNKTRYEISTGGWSGNEDLIQALEENMIFWSMCWEFSKRGGRYGFLVKDKT